MSKRIPPPQPTPSPSLAEGDRRLLAREYADVRPLRPGPARIPQTPTRTDALRPRAKESLGERKSTAIVVERQAGRILAAVAGVSRATLHALARGEPPIASTCDLHGLRAEAARAQLCRFIVRSAERGWQSVRVVCGRGLHSGPAGPVLLGVAVEALGQPPLDKLVVAFVTAPAGQGGEGSLIVRLRSRRHSRS